MVVPQGVQQGGEQGLNAERTFTSDAARSGTSGSSTALPLTIDGRVPRTQMGLMGDPGIKESKLQKQAQVELMDIIKSAAGKMKKELRKG